MSVPRTESSGVKLTNKSGFDYRGLSRIGRSIEKGCGVPKTTNRRLPRWRCR